MIEITNLQRLELLRNHLIKMDSGSGEAELLTWAIRKIEKSEQHELSMLAMRRHFSS